MPPFPALQAGEGREDAPVPVVSRTSRRRMAVILFVLTCATTFIAGTGQFREPRTVIDPATGKRVAQIEIDPDTRRPRLVIDWQRTVLNGLTYAAAVMVMLGAHEMGHYLQARRYGVPASLPLFIPMPIGPIGTMGAVIIQQAGTADRKSMFDIAITGPLAGLAVALPLNWWGIEHTRIEQLPPNATGWTNPLIVEWMVSWIKEPLQPGQDIILNPILFAGWVGIFITGLNLIPIGQLDGGHILYCLLGKKAHAIARALYVGAIGFVIFQAMNGRTEYAIWDADADPGGIHGDAAPSDRQRPRSVGNIPHPSGLADAGIHSHRFRPHTDVPEQSAATGSRTESAGRPANRGRKSTGAFRARRRENNMISR